MQCRRLGEAGGWAIVTQQDLDSPSLLPGDPFSLTVDSCEPFAKLLHLGKRLADLRGSAITFLRSFDSCHSPGSTGGSRRI